MILVVDDNTLNRMILVKMIKRMGLNTYTVANGKEAVDYIRDKDDIRLVLMDIMMPIMDGYEATKKIREFKTAEELPIIAVTADTTEGSKDRCLDVGCNEYVYKPIKKEVIEEVIKRYFVS